MISCCISGNASILRLSTFKRPVATAYICFKMNNMCIVYKKLLIISLHAICGDQNTKNASFHYLGIDLIFVYVINIFCKVINYILVPVLAANLVFP